MEVTQPLATQTPASTGNFIGNTGTTISSIFLNALFLIILIIIIFIAWKIFKKFLYTKSLSKNSNQEKAFLQIKIPQNNDKKAEAMENFLRSLHRVLPNNTQLSLEMGSANQFLSFYIVIEKAYKNVLESQLYAQFPEAEVFEVADYLQNLDNAAVEELDFKHSSIQPFKTYQQLEEDLLQNMSALLSKTETNEKAFIQISLKRVGSKTYERGFKNWYQQIFSTKQSEEGEITSNKLVLENLYLGKLRIIYIASDKMVSKNKLLTLLSIFKLVKSATNELKVKFHPFRSNVQKSIQNRIIENGDFFTPAELATLYHFPTAGTIVSNVVQTTSKRGPAPDILPTENLFTPQEVSFFGETNYRNDHKKFGVKRIDRRRHLYVVGKTGSGKSRLLQLLLLSDIQTGQGCCLLDPHGDLADELLMFVPKERVKDVVYVNPADRDFPIGFNPLEPVPDYETRQHLSTFFISIFKKQFAATWNPRMEHLIRYITLALLETPDSNILGIPRILSDTAFRQRIIMQIQDPVVKGFWTNEFSTSGEQLSKEAIVPIMNKVGQFVANPIVRNMIGQKNNNLNFSKFMDEGKIVLINVSKGKLGDENSALLGAMFITKIQQAALARANVDEDKRRDFYFYVDEFQNFATDAFSSILSEARKYHLDLTIAHQYMAQLPAEVKATAFGNVGTIITFAIGGDDAAYMAKEFSPTFSADDMINLNNREMYIKMSIDGKINPPFSAQTITIPKPSFDFSEEILSNSRLTYGKNRVAVENEIKRWTESTQATDATSEKDKFPEPII